MSCLKSSRPLVFNKTFPLLVNVNETSGCPKDKRLTISTIFKISVLSERKYFKRAGVLKNKSLTVILVPFGEAASS